MGASFNRAALATVEATYRLEGSTADWLRRILACARPALVPDLAAQAYDTRGHDCILLGCLVEPGGVVHAQSSAKDEVSREALRKREMTIGIERV